MFFKSRFSLLAARRRRITFPMNSKDYLALTQRDAHIVEALASAIRTMSLINGSAINVAGISRMLRLEDEMLRLHEALLLLGIDSNEFDDPH